MLRRLRNLKGADGVVIWDEMFPNDSKQVSRTDHPVRANFGGLRHYLLDGAATPPLQGGEYVRVQHRREIRLACGQEAHMVDTKSLYATVLAGALALLLMAALAQAQQQQQQQPAPVTPNNAHRLQPVWVFSTGQTSGHEAPPIVNNGVMFAATPGNQVIALNAKTGALLWRFRRPPPEGAIVPHQTTRGVALYGDKVFFAAGEAVLVAVDARTGKEVWATEVADNKAGYYMTLAPLVADGKVLVGASGGELGIRGFVAAYDPDTGKEVWRVYTVPAPGEPGSETWPNGDQWKTGGGSVWVTGNYDPETNLAYWGTGNGGPWMGDQRPGDNLYTSSTIAIDLATGTIKGHFQYHPNDSWDWDEVSPPVLVDYKRNSRTIK